jgi:hypothetical protein
MSASTLRYKPHEDGNCRLRKRLMELASQPRRHGYRMLHSPLRIDAWTGQVIVTPSPKRSAVSTRIGRLPLLGKR